MNRTLHSLLNLNPKKNISVFGFFCNYPIEEYYIEGNSVLILGKSDHLWVHISSSSKKELESVLAKYNTKTKYYFSVEDWMIPIILKYGYVDWKMTTNRYLLEDNISINSPESEIVSLKNNYAEFIYKNSDYKEYISIDYIEDRLSKDVSAGILINNVLVAWGFTHDDGAFGFLHVLDRYRNKGYGTDILSALIQMKRKLNKPVFGNIILDNTKSINLVTKLGFKLDRKVSWIKLK